MLYRRESGRLARAWDGYAHKIRATVARKMKQKSWAADDFADDLDGLDDEMVNEDAYLEAVDYGRKAFPGRQAVEAAAIAGVWTKHVGSYARKVPKRIAAAVADDLRQAERESRAQAEAEFGDDVGAATKIEAAVARKVASALDVSLTTQEHAVVRYAEPTWGAGQNGYAAELQAAAVMVSWVLESDNPCDDCVELAQGSPYDVPPTYPGMGDTVCVDRCKCTLEADPQSWQAANLEGD